MSKKAADISYNRSARSKSNHRHFTMIFRYTQQVTGILVFMRSLFSDIYTDKSSGGAIKIDMSYSTIARIDYSSFENCSVKKSSMYSGGAIYVGASMISCRGTCFTRNFAYEYGCSISHNRYFTNNPDTKYSNFSHLLFYNNGNDQTFHDGAFFTAAQSIYSNCINSSMNTATTSAGAFWIATKNSIIIQFSLFMNHTSPKSFEISGTSNVYYSAFINLADPAVYCPDLSNLIKFTNSHFIKCSRFFFFFSFLPC